MGYALCGTDEPGMWHPDTITWAQFCSAGNTGPYPDCPECLAYGALHLEAQVPVYLVTAPVSGWAHASLPNQAVT
jgi:hypothetical protein